MRGDVVNIFFNSMSCHTFESVQHGLSQYRHDCSLGCIQLSMVALCFTDLKNRKK